MKQFLLCNLMLLCFLMSTNRCSELIILLDQSGSHENVTNNFVSLTHELLAALHSQCCPILVSSFIWKNILEKKREAVFAQTQPSCPEKPTLDLYAAINKRCTELYSHQKTKQAIADTLNAEFYSQAALERLKKENKTASWAYTDFVVMDNFTFDADAWHSYWVNDHLLLFVPNKLTTTSGLKLDQLEHVEDLCDLESIYLHTLSKSQEPFLDSLKKLFLTNKELATYNYQPHTWTIILEGHGRNIHEAPREAGRIRYIADLSLPEYKRILHFFDTEITTHLLVSGSCQSSGLLWQKMMKNGDANYHYPILLSCLTDITSYGYVIRPKLPFLHDGFLSAHDIAHDTKNKTVRLHIDYLYRYADFFKTISEIQTFDNAGLEKLKTALPAIIEPHLSNTPVFFAPQNQKMVLYNPATMLYLNKESLAVSTPLLCTKDIVLLDAPEIKQSVLISSKAMPRIVSVTPGKAYHRLSSLSMQNFSFDAIAQIFWPLKGLSVDKFFFIDELNCLPSENYSMFASDSKAPVVLKNVLLHIQKDAYMRLSFACNDQVYSAHARLIDKQPVIKDLHVMRRMMPHQYETVYASLQQRKRFDLNNIKLVSTRRRCLQFVIV